MIGATAESINTILNKKFLTELAFCDLSSKESAFVQLSPEAITQIVRSELNLNLELVIDELDDLGLPPSNESLRKVRGIIEIISSFAAYIDHQYRMRRPNYGIFAEHDGRISIKLDIGNSRMSWTLNENSFEGYLFNDGHLMRESHEHIEPQSLQGSSKFLV